MDENFNAATLSGQSTATSFDAGLRAHMQRVFNYMGIGLAVTGLLAWVTANTALAGMIWGSPIRWLVIFAPLAFVLFMQFRMQAISAAALRATFFAYCAVMGLSLSVVFLVYTSASVDRAFFITAATFGAMSLWGYTTKRDLTSLGSFMMMGVLGLVIASVVNMFLNSPGIYWVISVLSVGIFTALTAYDTQSIKQTYSENWGQEANDKLAVFGALRLYMDFINIFVNLLRLMGDRK